MEQEGISLNLEQIKALLPHRAPFLLIERVVDLVPDVRCTGFKSVTLDEPYFRNMRRDYLFVPPALIIESMAQTAAIGALYTLRDEVDKRIAFLTGVQAFELHRQVRPGDTMTLRIVKERSFGPSTKVSGQAHVDDTLVAQARFTATLVDQDAVGF